MLGFSFRGVSLGAPQGPAPMVLSSENLYLYQSGETAVFAGAYPKLAWPGNASAASSGGVVIREPAGGAYDPPPVSGPALSGQPTVLQSAGDPYPAFEGFTNGGIISILGSAGARSCTIAAIVRPDAAAALTLIGGKIAATRSNIISFDNFLGLYVGDSAGVCQVGFACYDDWSAIAYTGTTPFTWPGGFGTWGTLIAVVDGTANTVRTYINGTDQGSQSVNIYRGVNGIIGSGKQGGGSYPVKQALRQALIWRRTLSPTEVGQLQLRFKADHPALP